MASTPSSPTQRRPCTLDMDGGSHRATVTCTPSAVDRLLSEIAFQRHRERQLMANGSRHRRRQRGDGLRAGATSSTDGTGPLTSGGESLTGAASEPVEDYDEAASAYWWTDVFLRYFVFEDDCANTTVSADTDDLLFFVRRRRRDKRKSRHHRQSLEQRQRVAYDTCAYRRQLQQQTTLLPIGDPAVLWRQTVCLNAIIHRLQYTLTVAVCARVPRKSTTAGVNDVYDPEEFEFNDQEYDLQLLSRHVHIVYASTSGRRMDAAKGPRERPVYPAVCWAVDDYAEAFRKVVVRPEQTVCVELVASWPSETVIEEYAIENFDDNGLYYQMDDGDCNHFGRHRTKIQQKHSRAVLFAGAVPYAAVRAAYECKMSLYRDAERQRRKRRQQQSKRGGGKKSSLGAALSASLTALFAGGKDPAGAGPMDFGDYDYYNGAAAASADRVEYVTVRGCRPGRDADVESSSDDENASDFIDDFDFDAISMDVDIHNTKGLAQMAIALAPVQPTDSVTACIYDDGEYHNEYCIYDGEDYVGQDAGCDYDIYGGDDDGYHGMYCDEANGYHGNRQRLNASTNSEPGDYYDYGWDYESAAGSEQQTPQTPSYHYQQQQHLEKRRRRGGRPRRLSDPSSTSVFDLQDDYGADGHSQQYCDRLQIAGRQGGVSLRQQQQQLVYQQQHHRPKLRSYGGEGGDVSAVTTPGIVPLPHRAWSESEGLDKCGGGWPYGNGLGQQRKQQRPLLMPPPPVPYYCAAEAAASGFAQFVRKSPGGWWTRTRKRRRMKRSRSRKERQDHKSSEPTSNRRRSASAGNNSYNQTDEENTGDSDSDDRDSDGEFIGALAAAAVVGHNPDREWSRRGAAGDPVADWERYDTDETSDSADVDDDQDTIEWTSEIVATDLRHKWPHRTGSMMAAPLGLQDFNNCCTRTPSLLPTPVTINRHQQQQQQQSFGFGNRQQPRHRLAPQPHFRPQPLEPPAPPPALSVAFTAVVCPWWTVLDDVLFVSPATITSGGQSSLNKAATRMPLLTFD